MSLLIVPQPSAERWPTLGPQVCAFIEENLIHGPGDLRGQPARLDKEKQALIHWMYEVFPRGHPETGRRRFKRVALSLRKGSAKTELAAWIAVCELHPRAPVRCIGWKGENPIGGGVTDPYIPMVAYTQEQSEELAYATLLAVIEEGPLARDFDCSLRRVIRRDGSGRAVALANAPGARDGARTTFQVFDETHRLVLPNQKAAHSTMLANVHKRFKADAWTLETTTAYSPGENSVAEDTMDYAREVSQGLQEDSRLFFFHRQAGGETLELETKDQIRAAVLEASGPVAQWSDIEGIVSQWQNPKADRGFLERVWLNRPIRQSRRAFDADAWRERAHANPKYLPAAGAKIVLGFDGGRFHDSTALIGCEIDTKHFFAIGVWEKPQQAKDKRESEDGWEVPSDEVDSALAEAFEHWSVWRMYADPPYWESKIDEWAGRYGKDVVVTWSTARDKPMSAAVKSFTEALLTGEFTHDGDPALARHIGNAVRRELRWRDDEGKPLFCIQKERPDSIFKIDAAMAALLAWEALGDAIKAGALMLEPEPSYQILFVGGARNGHGG